MLTVLFLLTACQSESARPLTVAAASSLQATLPALTAAFAEETGIGVETVLASSGKLTAQLLAGAPYDVFLSADRAFGERLAEGGLTRGGSEIYAFGELVLWSRLEENLSHHVLVGRIALAQPETAPYGRAAVEVLHALGEYDRVRDHLVYGESVGQATRFVDVGAADIGFTTRSLLVDLPGPVYVTPLDPDTYAPIEQTVIVMNGKTSAATMFRDFLFTERARAILEEYGYRPVR